MEPREIKGLEIAAKLKLVRGSGNIWHVPSQSNKQEKYTVTLDDENPQCTCRDYEIRSRKCKHIFAVEYTIERESTVDGQTVVTETVKVTRKTYSQNWPAYNASQTHEKSELQALLYELCRSLPEPQQHMGRPRLSLADIIFSSTFKVYSTMSGRRFMTDLREAKARGYLSKLPHYNSVFRYLEAQALTPYLYQLITASSLPLRSIESDFAVDSSGFSTGQFIRWLDVKYGKEEDRRMWLKAHLICGVKTNIVTSVEISDGYAHDYHYFKSLVNNTADNGFKMSEVWRTRHTWVGRIFLRLCVTARSRIFPLNRTLKSKPVMAQSPNSGRECSIFTTYTATSSSSTTISGPTSKRHLA
jgi:hypothetical protein